MFGEVEGGFVPVDNIQSWRSGVPPITRHFNHWSVQVRDG